MNSDKNLRQERPISTGRARTSQAAAGATPPRSHLPSIAPRAETAVEAPGISVVIPAYNEQDRIVPTLAAIHDYLTRWLPRFELIVVDDGSTDATCQVVADFAAQHPNVALVANYPNRGKGHAVRTGMLLARGDLVLFSDADLATPIEELESLSEAVREGADVAVGSRALKSSVLATRQPWYRVLAGQTLNRFVRWLVVPGIRDTQCGFKLFRRDASHDLFKRSLEDGFGFDIEVLHLSHRLGYKIAEVPIQWHHREGSKVRMVRDSLRMLGTIATIRMRAGSYTAKR